MSVVCKFAVLLLILSSILLVGVAKKTKPSFKSFGPLLEQRHQCEMCHTIVYEAFDMAEEVRHNHTQQGLALREETILSDVLDHLCNPYLKQGQWIRLIDISVQPRGGQYGDEMTTALRALENFSKCRRKCTTLAEICRSIVDSDDADSLPAMLLRGKMPVERIDRSVCTSMCARTANARSKAIPSKLIAEVQDERVETIDGRELDIEAMMEDMELKRGGPGGAPSAEVFSRDEMLHMQQALREGDLETLKELDPSTDDLTQEDMEYLRRMYRGEAVDPLDVEE